MVKNDPKIKTQKLIIPKGTIDANDTTIIEIPVKLQKQPIVIAQRTNSNLNNTHGTTGDLSTRDGYNQTGLSDTFADFQTHHEWPHLSSTFRDQSSSGTAVPRTRFPENNIQQHPFNRRTNPIDNSYVNKSFEPNDVEEIEQIEQQLILEELQRYQQARRRFLEDTSAITTKSKMAMPRQSERTETFDKMPRNNESFRHQMEPKSSIPHSPSETQAAFTLPGEAYEKYSANSYQRPVMVSKVCSTTPNTATIYHKMPYYTEESTAIDKYGLVGSTSSVDCRACCSFTEKSHHGLERERKRPDVLSPHDLCEITTQFREARKKLDRVMALAFNPNETASGVSLSPAPCQKTHRSRNIDYGGSTCSNVLKNDKPRELDPLLVSRDMQLEETTARRIDRGVSADREASRRETQSEAFGKIKSKSKERDLDIINTTKPSGILSQSSRSSRKIDTIDSYDFFKENAHREDTKSTRDFGNTFPLNQRVSKHSGGRPSQSQLGEDDAPSLRGRENPRILEHNLADPNTTDGVRASSSKRSSPQESERRALRSSNFETSSLLDLDAVNNGVKQKPTSFETRMVYGLNEMKKDCSVCCNLEDNTDDVRPVESMVAFEELHKIRQEFQRATRRIQEAVTSLTLTEGNCMSKSGTFPCSKH